MVLFFRIKTASPHNHLRNHYDFLSETVEEAKKTGCRYVDFCSLSRRDGGGYEKKKRGFSMISGAAWKHPLWRRKKKRILDSKGLCHLSRHRAKSLLVASKVMFFQRFFHHIFKLSTFNHLSVYKKRRASARGKVCLFRHITLTILRANL